MSMIEVKNLGKKYIIGERQSYLALRDTLTNLVKSPLHWFKGKVKSGSSSTGKNEFWALEDIDFTIEKGEVVGIIGRNGAGKSTLLKVLSQITPPTTGEVRLGGRVGSLLEVGTGFHPELTGRENIFLNGAILGMRKKEIERKLEEIIEFAGIKKFIDTPVKRYSSGMYVRLAFSVAAHLEPEILLVDEVLAVGDTAFQKKCLGKMEDVTKKEGRTILFVSHNMGAIRNLCNRTILLDGGKVIAIGETESVIEKYMSMVSQKQIISMKDRKDRKGNGKIRVTNISFKNSKDQEVSFFESGDDVSIICKYEVFDNSLKEFKFAFSIDTFLEQNRIAYVGNKITGENLEVGKGSFTVKIKNLPLNVGKYTFTVICTDSGVEIYDWIQKAGEFDVEFGNFYGNNNLPPLREGFLLLDYSFEQ
jgi:lipopolysaccharide transport system ATP-binding protein